MGGCFRLTNAQGHKKLAVVNLLFVCDGWSQAFGGGSMRHIISSLVIVIVAVGILTACNSAEKGALSSAADKPCTGPLPADGACRVTVAQLKELVANNEAFIVDVRNQASYDMGHIRGAKLIPEAEVINRVDELPRNKLIVTYCS
jgi:hypothetical protein